MKNGSILSKEKIKIKLVPYIFSSVLGTPSPITHRCESAFRGGSQGVCGQHRIQRVWLWLLPLDNRKDGNDDPPHTLLHCLITGEMKILVPLRFDSFRVLTSNLHEKLFKYIFQRIPLKISRITESWSR